MQFETFLICLGAQKSGTTWLWRYVRAHPQCEATPLKELHFFDGKPERFSTRIESLRQELAAADATANQASLEARIAFFERGLRYVSKPERRAEDFAGTELLRGWLPALGKD